MAKKKNRGRHRPDRETDEEFEDRMNAKADDSRMKPYTRRSDLPFVRMAERYGGAVMKEEDE